MAASSVDDGYNSPSASYGLGGRHGHWVLLGFREVTNEKCGLVVGLKACLDYFTHNAIMKEKGSSVPKGGQVTLAGANVKNKVAVHVVVHHCFNSGCPICYDAYAIREAGKAEQRLEKAEMRFSGKAEHYILSYAPNSPENRLLDSEGDHKKYFKRVLECLKARGIVGGLVVFHGFRFDKVYRHWFWSPHAHILGFRRGGYDCRSCEKVGYACVAVCEKCHGFEAVTRRCYERDKAIVKVAVDREGESRERDSLFATVLYELRHSTIRDDAKRAHPCFWFGTVSYRKFKVIIEKRKPCVCPICGGELEWVVFVGRGHIETDVCSLEFKRNFITEMFDSDGEERFLKRPSGSYGER
jgi:hypothetical protein